MSRFLNTGSQLMETVIADLASRYCGATTQAETYKTVDVEAAEHLRATLLPYYAMCSNAAPGASARVVSNSDTT